MKTTKIMLVAATALSLGACDTMNNDRTVAAAGTGAAIGAAGGAGVAALTGGDLLTGAAIGAAVGGIAGAVWADHDNDGRVDGYHQNGQYYPGAPAGYQPSSASRANCRNVGTSALTGAGVGAAAGAGLGAVAGGISPLEGALAGAAVGGLAGAVWADSNNDGCVDGYTREGRYYEGAPYQSAPASPAYTPTGERG